MITRAGTTIMLQGACTVEDADTLLSQLQDGADCMDISACTLLHTACLQELLAARETTACLGTPASPALAQWVAPLILAADQPEN